MRRETKRKVRARRGKARGRAEERRDEKEDGGLEEEREATERTTAARERGGRRGRGRKVKYKNSIAISAARSYAKWNASARRRMGRVKRV
ncbi:hypothetical protein Syun_003902 [Stephania yunnanensis]|uniref:Uncharacterized protein n=1 Tax=Stephania yunnanensis TaxID=152371 RepID=A0AAP0Q0Z7_9MAGN